VVSCRRPDGNDSCYPNDWWASDRVTVCCSLWSRWMAPIMVWRATHCIQL